jgi:murein DD-endopeptidase MepM/ murein hydrolase activator NlpD
MTTEIKLNQPVNDYSNFEQRDQKLRKACQDFESIFTYQLLRSMRATIDKSGLMDGGQGEEIYESMLDQELAKNMMGWGPNGLAYALYQQMKGIDSKGLEGADGSADQGQPLWPVKADEISSGFGWRKDPFNGENQFHYGVDLPAEAGTPVKAALDGRVLLSGHQEGYGNFVVLDHGKGFTTLYAHNQENEVQKGAWVKKGESIAKVGSSGRSTGPHLHFEVRKNGQYLNPTEFLHTETAGL